MIKNAVLPRNILDRLELLSVEMEKVSDVDALYLFGSVAHGRINPLSDVDLAVLLREGLTRAEKMRLTLDVAGLTEAILKTGEFDLVILNDAPRRIAYNILKNGRALVTKNVQHLVDFREATVKRHLDFIHYKKDFDKAFLEGIGYNG